MKLAKMATIALMGAVLLLGGCLNRAVSNVQTMISDDCGQNWKLVEVGNAIPARMGTCALQTTVPNYPMAGESTFRATFKNRVRVLANASYSYNITDPVKYISGARFVGQQNSAGDDPANGATVWDMAENIIIDRKLRDIANSPEFLQSLDIVDYDEGKLDEDLKKRLNAELKERGVELADFTFVVTPDDQTRNMIDIAAALRVCATVETLKSDACERITIARASAPRVIVNTTAPEKQSDS